MRNIFLFLIISLFFACGGSKEIIKTTQTNQNPQNVSESEISESPQVIDKPIEETPVEEKIIEEPSEITETAIESKETLEVETKEAFDHNSWNDLLKKYVAIDGTVNYKGFKRDRSFKNYLSLLSENIPDETWTKEDKLAYWMNAYNAFTIKLIINNYPLKSIKDINEPWDLRFFKLGKKWYTLNDLEHRILRKMGDPRIHFGINCASFSCPPLLNKAFTAQNVDQELEKLAVTFINDSKRNIISTNSIKISKIFSWFAKDFKTKGSLIDFLNTYSKIRIKDNASISYKTYDWNLNE
ncbi:DUF547 domain-containing protein [Aquimarina sp. 2201CG5-10]|uniref:DUF547 domain-containing protein n=1 Tax=Aquimarina callyspongiae TaxID=3098150 RepID=UPI002AB5B9EC|nr:DUF547 domain-containing protein [Aquimarina sp. 2201CG5-10]MDY8134764.1 DUF547 domain-containing protein [Aquimarina sp. 2201CG5-10]